MKSTSYGYVIVVDDLKVNDPDDKTGSWRLANKDNGRWKHFWQAAKKAIMKGIGLN